MSYIFSLEMLVGPDSELPNRLRNLEPRLIEHVSNEIMDQDPNVRWDDIGKFNMVEWIDDNIIHVYFYVPININIYFSKIILKLG